MADKNAYFQFIIENGETKLKIYPSEEHGNFLEIEEVIKYLEKNGIKDYDLKKVKDVVNFTDENNVITVFDNEIYKVDEQVDIKIPNDKKEAEIRFYSPSNLGEKLSKEEILKKLNEAKVTYGIDESVIQKHLLNPQYCYTYKIARAKEPIEGADAYITYLFDTEIVAKPKLNDDGTVDFHKLENINHVKVGQELARLTPEDTGEPGIDVFGNEIRPKKVIRTILRFGKNIELSEDSCTITSMIDGHVTLEGDRVFVNNLYEVPSDVNNSTGDIEYEGNILIRGTVRTGFKVKASGSIEVAGVVEAAELQAGGDIILRRGMQGMGKGMLIAKGDIVAKFLENSIAVSEGNISADSILHSRISAKGEVKVTGKNGNIIGGHTRSAAVIEAKTIGTSMGTNTVVEVGIDPHIKDRMNQLNKLISTKQVEIEKLSQLKKLLEFKKDNGTLDRAKKDILFKTISNLSMVKEELEKYSEENEELINKMKINSNAMIKVNGEIYPGVKVCISDDFLLIQDIQHYCVFRKVNEVIKIMPL